MQINQIIRNYDLGEMDYPCGKHINLAKDIARIMGNILIKEYPYPISIRLICQGSSGAIMAALIAAYIDIFEIIHIKKKGEHSHSWGYKIRENLSTDTCVNIIVDDFISSGYTVARIIKDFKLENPTEPIEAIIVSKDVDYQQLMDNNKENEITINKLICKTCDYELATPEVVEYNLTPLLS